RAARSGGAREHGFGGGRPPAGGAAAEDGRVPAAHDAAQRGGNPGGAAAEDGRVPAPHDAAQRGGNPGGAAAEDGRVPAPPNAEPRAGQRSPKSWPSRKAWFHGKQQAFHIRADVQPNVRSGTLAQRWQEPEGRRSGQATMTLRTRPGT